MKISEIFFSFFSTLNQYFPHISFVASKNNNLFPSVTCRRNRRAAVDRNLCPTYSIDHKT
jgi:hypothetical protein